MLEKLKALSGNSYAYIKTQKGLLTKAEIVNNKTLDALLIAYQNLKKLISIAENQRATLGLYLLSYHLHEGQNDLNALELLNHFLLELELPLESNENKTNGLSILKALSFYILMCGMLLTALLFPLVLSGLISMSFARLLLSFMLCTLPMAITYYFDKPFSMSKLYHELYTIERALAASAALTGLGALSMALTGMLPFLPLVWMSLSVSLVGLSLGIHSYVLETKYTHLKEATDTIKREVKASFLFHQGTQRGTPRCNFFDNHSHIKTGLKAITLSHLSGEKSTKNHALN